MKLPYEENAFDLSYSIETEKLKPSIIFHHPLPHLQTRTKKLIRNCDATSYPTTASPTSMSLMIVYFRSSCPFITLDTTYFLFIASYSFQLIMSRSHRGSVFVASDVALARDDP